MTVFQCFNCKHYAGNGICAAFQLGIPDNIFIKGERHDTVLDNQDMPVVFEYETHLEQAHRILAKIKQHSNRNNQRND